MKRFVIEVILVLVLLIVGILFILYYHISEPESKPHQENAVSYSDGLEMYQIGSDIFVMSYFDGEGCSYLWSTGDTVAHIAALPGETYSVTVTSDNGCMVTGSFVGE